MVMPPSLEPRSHQCPDNTSKPRSLRDRFNEANAPLRVLFGRRGPAGGEVFGSRAIPQAKPRTIETPNAQPALGGCRGTKKRLRTRWIRMPDRGSLWLLPSGPDQIRNMSSSEPIERARRSVYLTRSRPAGQVGRTHRMDSPHSCISLAAPAAQGRAAGGKAVNRKMRTVLKEVTSDTPETSASLEKLTTKVSAMPTNIRRNCSTNRGRIRFRRSRFVNIVTPHTAA